MPAETLAAMRQAWIDLGEVWRQVDPALPAWIADLLDEYAGEDADEAVFLTQVRALASLFRSLTDPQSTVAPDAPWWDLAEILPSLWI